MIERVTEGRSGEGLQGLWQPHTPCRMTTGLGVALVSSTPPFLPSLCLFSPLSPHVYPPCLKTNHKGAGWGDLEDVWRLSQNVILKDHILKLDYIQPMRLKTGLYMSNHKKWWGAIVSEHLHQTNGKWGLMLVLVMALTEATVQYNVFKGGLKVHIFGTPLFGIPNFCKNISLETIWLTISYKWQLRTYMGLPIGGISVCNVFMGMGWKLKVYMVISANYANVNPNICLV